MSDNEMSGPAPTESERVHNLEQAVAEMKSEIAASHKLFQSYISQQMGKTPPTEDPPPSPRRPASRLSDTTSAGQKKLSLKPSTPSEFGGDRAKGKAFLTSCRTYIRLCPEAFNNEVQQIVWAMSYMKTGRAGRWAAHEFELEAGKGKLRFRKWPDFEDEFSNDCTPLTAEAEAVKVLETAAYHQ